MTHGNEYSFAEQTIIFDTATKRLQEFDGKTPPLREFIEDLEHAHSLLPECLHPNLVNLIKSLLKGSARSCLNGKSPNSLEEITDILIEYFAPGKSYPDYLQEIQNIKIYKDESITEFYTRLMHLIDLAKSSLYSVYPKKKAAAMFPQLDLISMHAFKNGVSDQMSYALNILDDLNTLDKVYKKAKTIELQSKENCEKLFSSNHSKGHIYTVYENNTDHSSDSENVDNFPPQYYQDFNNCNYNQHNFSPQNFEYYSHNHMPMCSPYSSYFMPPFYPNFPNFYPYGMYNAQNHFENNTFLSSKQWSQNPRRDFQGSQGHSSDSSSPNFLNCNSINQNSSQNSEDTFSCDSDSLNSNAASQADVLGSALLSQRPNLMTLTLRQNQKNSV